MSEKLGLATSWRTDTRSSLWGSTIPYTKHIHKEDSSMTKKENMAMIMAEMATNGITPKVTILKAQKAPKKTTR
jgi:hypothetical protein